MTNKIQLKQVLRNIKIITVFCLLAIVSKGQDQDSLFLYRGQVLSKEKQYPVAMAHVINYRLKKGVVADTSGYFETWVTWGDTLNISAIGFEYLEHKVLTNKDTLIEIYLKSRIYSIPEVSISYLGTYKEFEQKVINLKLSEIKFNDEIDKLFKHVEVSPVVVPSTSIFNPASLIYSLFSKEAKDTRKYVELEKEGKIKDKVRERYNVYIIRNITGLDLDEARAFMAFCDFHDKYILSTSDYYLYSQIMLSFQAYKKSKQDSLLIE